MRRVASLLVVGVLAVLAGAVASASGGRAAPEASRSERAAADARKIGRGVPVKVSLTDGTSLKGVLVDIQPEAVRVLVTKGPKGERIVAFSDIERIKKDKSHSSTIIILSVVAAVLLVPIGICAAAA
jgi:flagellar basal body-associated protein FliL